MVDAHDSGSCGEIYVGSSPIPDTIKKRGFNPLFFIYKKFSSRIPHPAPPRTGEGINYQSLSLHTPSPTWGRLGWGTIRAINQPNVSISLDKRFLYCYQYHDSKIVLLYNL